MSTSCTNSLHPQSAHGLEDLLHALNQPLTQIRCALELMFYRSVVPDDCRESLATVLRQTERASKLSLAMQQVLEIEREHRAGGQSAALAPAVEAALDDFSPLAEHNGIKLVPSLRGTCRVAVSQRCLGIALFLLFDQMLSWAKPGDTIEAGITADSSLAHLSCRLVASAEDVHDESQLLVLKSICGAFNSRLNLRHLHQGLELELSIPIAPET